MKITKRTIAAVAAALLLALPCAAQNMEGVKKFNFLIKAGATFPLNGNPDTSNKIGPQLGLEARWNLRKVPVDVGAELYVGGAVRNYIYGEDLSHRTCGLLAIADYNFNRGSQFAPFAGMGIGIAACQNIVGSYGNDYTRMCFAPRVGFTAFRHLRVTLDAHITVKNYSHAGLSVGYQF